MFLRTDFRAGDPVRKVANARNLNRIGRILETIRVVGGRLQRDYSCEGAGWILVIDGASDANIPSDVAVLTSDRMFAVDSYSSSRLGRDNFYGYDTTGFDANCIPVAVTVDASGSDRQLRHYVRVTGTSTTPSYMLGLDTQGNLVKVAVTDTCA
jgi:hypothetical protein